MKRVYEPVTPADGYRVLVDRLWPRGLSKEHAAVDEWLKAISPSDGLRRWFGHDPERFREFRARYVKELGSDEAKEALAALAARAGRKTVTLVYAAHDEEHNNAVVLVAEIARRMRPRAPRANAPKKRATTPARRTPRTKAPKKRATTPSRRAPRAASSG